jgi:hypothetical protein
MRNLHRTDQGAKRMNAAKPISDRQIDFALRNIRAKINEDQDGYFDGCAVSEVIEHCLESGPALLYAMARASLPILPAKDAARIVRNRAKALYAYVVLQKRAGEQRLFRHLSNQSFFGASGFRMGSLTG